mmetsp:Transcript_29182/g.67864  ORF Transcript_29182/g.67864 Transcript_29182/m.67864 type:complete len:256 (+) Transcript_29182:905-1672(+)
MFDTTTLRCNRSALASLPEAAATLSAAAAMRSAAALSALPPALAVEPVAGIRLLSCSGSSMGTHSTADFEAGLEVLTFEPFASAVAPASSAALAALLRFLAAQGAASSTCSPEGASCEEGGAAFAGGAVGAGTCMFGVPIAPNCCVGGCCITGASGGGCFCKGRGCAVEEVAATAAESGCVPTGIGGGCGTCIRNCCPGAMLSDGTIPGIGGGAFALKGMAAPPSGGCCSGKPQLCCSGQPAWSKVGCGGAIACP